MNVHSSFICNRQNLETAQTSINRWTDKQIVVYPYNGIFFSNKKDKLSIYTVTWINSKELSWVNEAKPKKKKSIWLHLHTTLKIQINLQGQKQIMVAWGWGGNGGKNDQGTERKFCRWWIYYFLSLKDRDKILFCYIRSSWHEGSSLQHSALLPGRRIRAQALRWEACLSTRGTGAVSEEVWDRPEGPGRSRRPVRKPLR